MASPYDSPYLKESRGPWIPDRSQWIADPESCISDSNSRFSPKWILDSIEICDSGFCTMDSGFQIFTFAGFQIPDSFTSGNTIVRPFVLGCNFSCQQIHKMSYCWNPAFYDGKLHGLEPAFFLAGICMTSVLHLTQATILKTTKEKVSIFQYVVKPGKKRKKKAVCRRRGSDAQTTESTKKQVKYQ